LVVTEPAFVLDRFITFLPALRDSLASLIVREWADAAPNAVSLADALIRLAMSHFLLPEPDTAQFERSVEAVVSAFRASAIGFQQTEK
jgi:hypothetical protein